MANEFNHASKFEPQNIAGKLDRDDFDNLVLWCTDAGSSDITVQSDQPVWCDVSGHMLRATKRELTHPEVRDAIRWIYNDNGPGEVNMGHDLDVSYEIKVKGRGTDRLRYRVNITCGRMIGGRGAQITIRTLPPTPIDINELGIEAEIIENLRPAQGLNLITGPTGSGKSTLLASAIRHLCEDPEANEKVLEYSRPIEFVYDDIQHLFPSSVIFQTEVGDHLRPKEDDGESEGSLWGYAVRNALRRKPTIILLGEARDKPTIQGCIEASLTGHLVMSTMHTKGVPETVRRAIQPFPGNERRGIAADLLECLNMVVTQELLPRVGGGRVGCREFMIFDRKVRAALVSIDHEEWHGRLREMLRERHVIGSSMSDSAKKLLTSGQISHETYEWIASRTAKESKVVRQALGSGLLSDLNEDED